MVCPFCGLVGDAAHDSQQACIEALQREIDRTRQLLEAGGPAACQAATPGSQADPARRPPESPDTVVK